MLKVLLIQRIFSIPTNTLLIVFLKYSQESRDFCGFDVVSDGSYSSMPTHAASNQAIQQMYINRYFCYAYKFGIITNGLGIVRDITFYNKDFLKSHPDIVVEKKSVPLIKINLLRIQRHCFQF